MINIYDIIAHNKEMMDNISADTYPNLFYLSKRSKIITRLHGIMDCLTERYAFPVFPEANPKYFIVPLEKIWQWCKSNRNISPSPRPWQSARVLLEDMGLLRVIHVRGANADPVLNSVFEKAKEKGFATCSLISFPLYTPELLQQADEVAGIYRERRVNLSHLTKTDVIRIRGAEIADKLYHGNTSKANPVEEEVFAEFHRILREAIARDGYMVANTLIDRLYETFQEKNERDYRYFFAIKKARIQRAELAKEDGFNLHCITRQDRENFHIASTYRKWIITR